GDIVEVDTWISANGKNGMRRHWHVHDSITSHTILKVTSVVLEMNINGRCLHLVTMSLRMWYSSRLCNSCSLPISEGIRLDRSSIDNGHHKKYHSELCWRRNRK
ncbi:hypothetical protein ACJX0J_014378, partial [Zea mays]